MKINGKILITGGAGYIGSSCTKYFLNRLYDVVVLDNLSTGHEEAVDKRAVFYNGDISDEKLLKKIIKNEKIIAVIHFAAFSLVGESMVNPYKYYENNVGKTNKMLQVLVKEGVKYIVFSSTAAVYGEPVNIPILETDPLKPTNVYGETKLAIEKMIYWYHKIYGLNYVALRYFNVAGTYDEKTGERHNPETHLIPLMCQSMLGKRGKFKVFGDNYNTPDGTCIRDYIHVLDLCKAHLMAVEYLLCGNPSDCFNLGSENGYSVIQMIKALETVSNKTLEFDFEERRAGDPAILIASSKKAQEVLKWDLEYKSIDKMINDTYIFEKNRK